jgi:hypothetical protein
VGLRPASPALERRAVSAPLNSAHGDVHTT